MKIKLLVESKFKMIVKLKKMVNYNFKCFVNIHIQAKVELLNL